MDDLISRHEAIKALKNVSEHYTEKGRNWHPHVDFMVQAIEELPSAEPMLYGYPVEHLAMIATVLRKENLSPEKIADVLADIRRIVAMVRDEFDESLRKAVEQCKI